MTADSSQLNSPFKNLSRDEVLAAVAATVAFFVILFSYYLLRPIREVHSYRLGPERQNLLFLSTFLVLLAVTPLWGLAVNRCSKKRLMWLAFTLIAGSLILFAALFKRSDSLWVSGVFYVWVSVFNYMMVSLFWSRMADVFTNQSGRRTFGIITAGGTAGAIAGPLVSSLLAHRVAIETMLVVASSLFCLVPAIVNWIPLSGHSDPGAGEPKDDSVWAGCTATFQSPYLLAIAGYLMLGSVLGSLLYVHQGSLVMRLIPLEADQRAFNSHMDLATNILALVFELIVAGPLLTRSGLRWPLLLLPVIGVVVAPLLTLFPTVTAVGVMLVLRRAIEYGLSKPAREVLFTVVSRSEKYKAKNFIDSVMARGGDTLGSTTNALVAKYHLPAIAALWIGVPVAVMFGILGLWLADEQRRKAARQTENESLSG